MLDFSQLKTGCRGRMEDDRNLRMADYFPARLPAIPKKARWDLIREPDDWGNLGNNIYGDCVWATVGHIVMCARGNESGKLRRIPDRKAIEVARAHDGLDGDYILRRLKIWAQEKLFGNKIEAFTEVDLKDHDLIRTAINIFGHCDIGIDLVSAWSGKDFWDVGSGADYSKIVGKHSIPLLGYYESHGNIIYLACTWGRIVKITQAAVDQHVFEQYASIVPAWYRKDKITPSGFAYEKLQQHLAEVRNGN